MKTAVEIMSSKKEYREEIEKILSREECRKLWNKAVRRLRKILDKYSDLPTGVHLHTDEKIFPAAAVYITAKEFMTGDQAYAVIENAAVAICAKARKGLTKAMRIPFMPSLFVGIWDPMTKKMFGADCGFRNKFYPKEKSAYRMDIIECPYNRYLTELGCPEHTKIFCDNDERIYGDLPGLVFERKGTIGKGFEKCDFYIT